MERIEKIEDFEKFNCENRFLGTIPQLINSQIIIKGKNNILFCEPSVKLMNSKIYFNGDNSIVYLCSSRHHYQLSANIQNNNVLYFGKNNYFNGVLNIILSEQKHCFIGNDCLFSFGIYMRNADPHLVYDYNTYERLNISKSIYVGDHVWIGQSALLLKGTKIDSGSIVGGMSVVAGKKIPYNESWGGNPCKKIKDSIFWDGACVHAWTEQNTEKSLNYSNFIEEKNIAIDAHKFSYDQNNCVSFEDIDDKLSMKNTDEIIEYLDYISSMDNKNRFAHKKNV